MEIKPLLLFSFYSRGRRRLGRKVPPPRRMKCIPKVGHKTLGVQFSIGEGKGGVRENRKIKVRMKPEKTGKAGNKPGTPPP